MGRAWVRNLLDHGSIEVVALVDSRPGQADAAAASLEIQPYTCTTLQSALEAVESDFVVDVTTPDAHHDVTVTALRAGLPVLGEKPMAASMEEAKAMVSVSEETGVLYMVSQSRRYDPHLTAFRGLIQERTGPLGILNSAYYMNPFLDGFRVTMASPLLIEMAIHTFDAARYLSGADAVAVYCDEFNPSWSLTQGAAAATTVFEMAGGLRYTYTGSFYAKGRATTWEAEWRAVGPHGTATWDGERAPVAETIGEHEAEELERATVPRDDSMSIGIAGSLRDFLNALEMGATPWGECRDNIKSFAMVMGAIASSKQGRKIVIDRH
jgi:predicted dehydrogenase